MKEKELIDPEMEHNENFLQEEEDTNTAFETAENTYLNE